MTTVTTPSVRLLARAAELGPLSLSDLIAAIPVVVPAAVPLGLTGLSGLDCLAATLVVAAGHLTRPDMAAQAVAGWLDALASTDVAVAMAARGVDLAGCLLAGGDLVVVATTATSVALSGDLTLTGELFADTDVCTVAQGLAGNLPVYEQIRDTALAYAAGSDPLVGLRALLRVA